MGKIEGFALKIRPFLMGFSAMKNINLIHILLMLSCKKKKEQTQRGSFYG